MEFQFRKLCSNRGRHRRHEFNQEKQVQVRHQAKEVAQPAAERHEVSSSTRDRGISVRHELNEEKRQQVRQKPELSETKVKQPTAKEERKWRELCLAEAEKWGGPFGSPEDYGESLYEYRLNNESFHEIAADKIENAQGFLQKKGNSISAAQTVRVSEEARAAMGEFSAVIDGLMTQGLSAAAVYFAMHNELSFLSEEITDTKEGAPVRWRGDAATKAPLFSVTSKKEKAAKA